MGIYHPENINVRKWAKFRVIRLYITRIILHARKSPKTQRTQKQPKTTPKTTPKTRDFCARDRAGVLPHARESRKSRKSRESRKSRKLLESRQKVEQLFYKVGKVAKVAKVGKVDSR